MPIDTVPEKLAGGLDSPVTAIVNIVNNIGTGQCARMKIDGIREIKLHQCQKVRMRHSPIVILIGLTVCSVALAQTPALADSFWTPSLEAVQRADDGIGAIVNVPGLACPARPKANFSRHYFGWTDEAGRRSLRAQFVLGSAETNQVAGVHIETRWYPIADGGCSVANVWFDADTLAVVQAGWGGQ